MGKLSGILKISSISHVDSLGSLGSPADRSCLETTIAASVKAAIRIKLAITAESVGFGQR